ncbi:YbaY family lipoprotein [Aidingimonas halophila]|uniref:Type III secretion system lipoprotein chaperone (YscW) n=1 Tax=Aidingimonas halophila TaxID=574349 RepID=A0A1H3FPE5_9GAMM|nr:YbaY family lipoprotein [Aidingimonas halophila]GHC38253.1 hypothetical protein GCM10008094_34560 [Aidingimonas halophila]SDX92866.1 Type III secretion system lipoprotein chaperone (YscW) [Aidingimonas halophila]
MPRRLFRLVTLLLSCWLMISLAACAGGPRFETLDVRVDSEEPIDTDDDAELRINLIDDTENERRVIAENRMERLGDPPYTATLRYDASAIDSDSRYVLRAELRQDGRLTHAEDEPVPVWDGGDDQLPTIKLVPLPRDSDGGN